MNRLIQILKRNEIMNITLTQYNTMAETVVNKM